MSRRAAPLPLLLVTTTLLAACAALHRAPTEELRVREVPEPIVVAAWAEPRTLPPGGGQAQIMIRVQKQGGRRYPDVEVRLHTSEGTLYSAGQTLVTDAQGMTRDRLTTRKTAVVTLNAGGLRYRFQVPVAEPESESESEP